MIKNLFIDIIDSIFGFLTVPFRFLKRPLEMHSIAKSKRGFALALSSFIWVLLLDVWIGSYILDNSVSILESGAAFDDQSEVIFDYQDEGLHRQDQRDSGLFSLMSTPLISELVVFLRILIVTLASLPAAMIIVHHSKNEQIFRSFMALNILLASVAGIFLLVLISLTTFIVLRLGNSGLISFMPVMTYALSALVGIPMFIIYWKNWRRLLPHISIGRLTGAFVVWFIGGIVVSLIYKGLEYL